MTSPITKRQLQSGYVNLTMIDEKLKLGNLYSNSLWQIQVPINSVQPYARALKDDIVRINYLWGYDVHGQITSPINYELVVGSPELALIDAMAYLFLRYAQDVDKCRFYFIENIECEDVGDVQIYTIQWGT